MKHRSSSNPPVKCDSKTPDVVEEERLTFDDSDRKPSLTLADAFRFVGVRKSYGFLGLPAGIARSLKLPVKTVVHSLSFTAHEGELFVLLGHNGAGKTTAMNVMMGEVNWENGNIHFKDLNMRDDLASFQEMLGVCPQHDILFQDLTPDEHIELFGGLKLMSRDAIAAAKQELPERLQLTRVRKKKAGQFSGGMKRRLSLMISLMGNPKIIILDEPTTGMDPVNRRAVWEVVGLVKHGYERLSQRLKPSAVAPAGEAATSKGNIVFLTTHSMEEAEVLGDKIAIMKKGYLQAVGNSIHLRTSLAGGYRLKVITPEGSEKATYESIRNRLQSAAVESVSYGVLKMVVQKGDVRRMFEMLASLRSDELLSSEIIKYEVSQMTLEDVFHILSADHYAASPDEIAQVASAGETEK